MEPNMDIRDIMKRLPHRYPFLLVDRVTTFVRGESLEAYKNVTFNEEFFQGHFPGRPVMPGVLIMEAMGQAGGILAFLSMEGEDADGAVIYFMGMDKVKFRRPVVPGDRLDFKVKLIRGGAKYWKLRGEAWVGDEKAAEAEMTAAIDIDGSV